MMKEVSYARSHLQSPPCGQIQAFVHAALLTFELATASPTSEYLA